MGIVGRPISTQFVALVVFFILVHETATAKKNQRCPPSSCGKIHNISHPFRLEHHPDKCGDKRYTLFCENNVTVLYLYSGKYYVQAINYQNYTIRVLYPNVVNGNCSTIPSNSLLYFNFHHRDPYLPADYTSTEKIIFFSCQNPVTSPLYIDPAPCITTTRSDFSQSKSYYSYVMAKREYIDFSVLEDSCRIELMVLASPKRRNHKNITNFFEIHNDLADGLELSWLNYFIKKVPEYGRCYLDKDTNNVICDGCSRYDVSFYKCGFLVSILNAIGGYYNIPIFLFVLFVAARFIIGTPFVICCLVRKWRRRHLSMYSCIEEFLQNQNNLMPIRYSYSDIKKMSKGFKERLGEGGYGIVYKGKLRSGHLVAIKLLGKSKANGQEFVNEVVTIGRIHHMNVVRLIGFCLEGSKRVLVYEFMSKGSLDKHIFTSEGMDSLSSEKMAEISLGVARGIEYLHQGCDVQILHFDIKPHNILLDENFNAKISDFGLARLCPLDNRSVCLTAARGTLGYMAPELFYKNIGGVSSKADVYSFGMLLMEMASRRKNLNAVAENSSQIYFPSWVYDRLKEGKDIELLQNVAEEEFKVIRKMIIVALWCIQLKPSDRPPIREVVKMLEGEGESLQMPPKPYFCPPEMPTENVGEESSNPTTSALSDSTS